MKTKLRTLNSATLPYVKLLKLDLGKIALLVTQHIRHVTQYSVQCKKKWSKSNITSWSTSYLSDVHPLVPATIVLHTTMINFIHTYIDTKECNIIYTWSKWSVSFLMIFYLTWIGYRCSKFLSKPKLFIYNFWNTWVVFVLLLTIQLSLKMMTY